MTVLFLYTQVLALVLHRVLPLGNVHIANQHGRQFVSCLKVVRIDSQAKMSVHRLTRQLLDFALCR